VNEGRGYGSPAAFRQALTAKLKAKAQEGPWTLAQLQRQMAYDRLLERLYLTSGDWIVKGATALLARDMRARDDRYRRLSPGGTRGRGGRATRSCREGHRRLVLLRDCAIASGC
jgi:hypothetical protein